MQIICIEIPDQGPQGEFQGTLRELKLKRAISMVNSWGHLKSIFIEGRSGSHNLLGFVF